MEKSIIANRSNLEQAVKAAVRTVRKWTKRELSELLVNPKALSQTPLIIAFGNNNYLVGNYAISFRKHSWQMIYRHNDEVIEFADRRAAIFYAVCQQSNRYEVANRILALDQNISWAENEMHRYKQRIKQCQQRRTQSELYGIRYQECQLRYQHSKFLLEKTLKMAKYNNI